MEEKCYKCGLSLYFISVTDCFSVFYGLFILSSVNNEVGYEYVSGMKLAQNCIQCRIWCWTSKFYYLQLAYLRIIQIKPRNLPNKMAKKVQDSHSGLGNRAKYSRIWGTLLLSVQQALNTPFTLWILYFVLCYSISWFTCWNWVWNNLINYPWLSDPFNESSMWRTSRRA